MAYRCPGVFSLTVSLIAASAAWAGPAFLDVRGSAGPPGRSLQVGLAQAVFEGPAQGRIDAARAAAVAAAGDEAPPGAPLEWRLVSRGRSGAGLEHFIFQARWEGVEIFDSWRIAHLTPGRMTVQYSAGGRARPPTAQSWELDEDAARERLIEVLEPASGGRIRAQQWQRVWFPLADGLRPAWEGYVDFGGADVYQAVVDAADGQALFVFPLAHEAAPRGRVFAAPATADPQDGPRTLEDWTGFPAGGACPADIYPAALVDGARAGACWTDGAASSGPNADVCLDPNSDNQCGGRALGEAGVFDFAFSNSYEQTGDPVPDRPAALANAFYWTNVVHDWLYRLGFDEQAGAFQADNFGRGGLAGDPVRVDVQDGGSLNSAQFVTPPDGIAPRMDLGLFAGPQRDSAFDADLIVHELVHGLTTRLVGGPTNVSSLFLWQSGGLSEGWSDAYAAAFIGDPIFGEYVTRNPSTGIRAVRYDQSPLTFGQFGVRRATVPPGTAKLLWLPQVHADGEIWASMLWDLRETLGRASWEQVVTAGLKMTPPRPSMLDARDGILAAAAALGEDECALWEDFAGRGMGASASLNPLEPGQPNDTALSVYEAFDPPATCGGSPAPTGVTVFFDDAESDQGWTTTGLWHRSTRRAASGWRSWRFGVEGTDSYATGVREEGELISPPIDLTGADHATLTWRQVYRGPGFFTRVEFGGLFAPYLNADAGRVWVSTDGGANWSPLTHIAHETPGSGFSDFQIDLSRFTGSQILVRFEMDTFDGADNDHEGWYLDDIRVTKTTVGRPRLAVDPGQLRFQTEAGLPNPMTKRLEIENTGGPGLEWTATVTGGGQWLSVTPGAGTKDGVLTVSASTRGLPAGSYVGSIRVSAGAAGVIDTPVALDVAPQAAPVAVWPFDVAGAGPDVTLVDVSGRSHHASTTGPGAAAVGGVFDGARLFNGHTDGAIATASSELTPASFTFRTWIKLFDLPSHVGVVASAFGGANYRGWYVAVDSQGRVILQAATPPDSAPWLVAGQQLAPGRWTCLAASYDGSTDEGRIYIGGVLAASATFPGLRADGTHPFTLGKASWAETWHLSAALDQPEIVPRALTATRIATDCAGASPPGPTANLSTRGSWSFDGDLLDGSGNGFDAAASGGAYVGGVSGQARRFDGLDDFATVAVDELLSPSDMTLRAWVKLNRAPERWGALVANYNADFEGWYLGVLGSGRLFFAPAAKPVSLPAAVAPAELAPGRWAHVTAVFEGAPRRLSLYLDGSLVDQRHVTGFTPRTSGMLMLGRASWIDTHYTSFDLDELRVDGRAWTADDVAADFAAFPDAGPAPPAALWSFDETGAGAGAVFADESGRGLDLEAVGDGNGPQEGVKDAAQGFAGFGGWAAAPADPVFATESFSFSAWVRLERYPAGWGAIFSTYDGDFRGWYLAVRADGRVILCVAGQPGSAPWLVTPQPISPGRWHHLAVTFEGSARRGLVYVDGVRAASAVFPAWTPSSGIAPTVGRASWTSTGFLSLWIDEARLASFARGPGAIADEHAAGAARQQAAPAAEWSMDESGSGDGLVLADAVGGHDAVAHGLGGAAQAGVQGGARRFGGFPDFAEIAADPALSPRSFSWTGWVKLDALPAKWGVLFANHSGDSRGWHGSVFPDGRLILAVSGQPGSDPWLMSSGALQPGQWRHVAFTFDGVARRGSIYIDGVRDETAVFPAWTPQSAVNPTFGKASWTDSYYLPVTLDRVRLYEVELSVQQVLGEM